MPALNKKVTLHIFSHMKRLSNGMVVTKTRPDRPMPGQAPLLERLEAYPGKEPLVDGKRLAFRLMAAGAATEILMGMAKLRREEMPSKETMDLVIEKMFRLLPKESRDVALNKKEEMTGAAMLLTGSRIDWPARLEKAFGDALRAGNYACIVAGENDDSRTQRFTYETAGRIASSVFLASVRMMIVADFTQGYTTRDMEKVYGVMDTALGEAGFATLNEMLKSMAGADRWGKIVEAVNLFENFGFNEGQLLRRLKSSRTNVP
jgi:hypothetical protein